ncbi:MAG: hypothetical protein JW751_25415 [Polyangiaceae bacterium]|nr:hypothetical protein [Polyangiaceae bacterium]
MPTCYLLAITVGSSLDQQSNNVTLFNLVEQVNIPPGLNRSVRTQIPLEIHAYFRLAPDEIRQPFEVRYLLVARTGLETYSDVSVHTAVTPRFRTRTFGVPFPPVADQYELRVEWRRSARDPWRRDPLSWPLTIAEHVPAPMVTH